MIIQVDIFHEGRKLASLSRNFQKTEREITIGRTAHADICICCDPRVSKFHAAVGVDESGNAYVRDLGSTNGTIVNDKKILPDRLAYITERASARLASTTGLEVRLTVFQQLSPKIRPGLRVVKDTAERSGDTHKLVCIGRCRNMYNAAPGGASPPMLFAR
jgi:pSer/pThr/pTyr-binding forkhead associated (FHA) protein